MKEIKVRAWDKVSNKMLYPGVDMGIHFYFDETGIVAERYSNILVDTPEGDRIPDIGHETLEHLQYLLFTGLKDKNGNEIYAGDIYHMGDPNITYTVVWHDTGFKGKQNSSSSYAGLDHWQERIEIVGNIYESKE